MTSIAPRPRHAAPVMEVFASIQGEGAFVGEPQVFLRLRGCPVRCRWCDTPASWALSGDDTARIDARAGGMRREPAFATPFQAACWIAEAEPGAPRTVSVTGGEPLVWPEFVLGLKPMLAGRRLHLETAGAHPRTLERVLAVCDHVSLDLKCDLDLDPPVEVSEGASPEKAPSTPAEWVSARSACLRLVRGHDACAKIIMSGERRAEDYRALLDEVEEHGPAVPVFLQPATPMRGVPAPSRKLVETVCEMARDRELSVRVVPQVHRLLKVP